MSDKIPVRVAGSYFGYNGERYGRGDTLEVHPRALEKHPSTLERVDEAVVQEDADDEEGVTVDDLDPHPSDLNVPELEERIAGVEDVELLETIRDAEEESEDRETAKDAIDARLNELEG